MAGELGYRRILVPVAGNVESERAMDVACRLASARAGTVTAVAVIEVPAVLPLDAHMKADERAAHQLLERHAAIADIYGVGVSPRLLRARDAGSAIVMQAELQKSELIVIGAPRRRHSGSVFGTTVEHVLKRARCRVLFIGSAPVALSAVHAAA
jgi:nucleotide-binding universal stress UspA family protein